VADPKAPSPAPSPAPPFPDSHEKGDSWVSNLSEKNRVEYFKARLAFAQAEDAYKDAVTKAANERDKPQQALDSAIDAYRAAKAAHEGKMTALVAKRTAIEDALKKLDPAKADDKSAAQVAEIQKALDDYLKVGLGDVAKAQAGLDAAAAGVRKLAEDTGGPPESAHLDPEAHKISKKQYELAEASAADPLDNAEKAFNAARKKLHATLAETRR
jgi:hypothetical protein